MDLLSSSRTNDEISSEVAELVGFDHIELVMDLLGSRLSAAKDVSPITTFVLRHLRISYSTALPLLGLEEGTGGKWHKISVVK